jgi:prepilin-type N-terminal cleavage/methylation domain-containing protein
MRNNTQKGFTLIELLIVIAIIAVLAAVVFVALNPAQRFADARDARRQSDIENIAAALKTYQVDNNGSYPASVAGLVAGNGYTIGTDASGCNSGCTAQTTQAACVDLAALVTGGYLGSVPMDPTSGTAAKTDYYLISNASGTVEIGACDPEGGAIEVIR